MASWEVASGFTNQAICVNFHITDTDRPASAAGPPDRLVVAKYLQPRRWDLIAFRDPQDASTVYIKRLVGLPGEEIVIKDGKVWADGRRLASPEPIRDIQYLTDDGSLHWPANWGSLESPAPLGAGEYFVLGDFSARSRDSRMWMTGAAGHPPYAVPESHLVGVVTHIYWPPSRWRVFR